MYFLYQSDRKTNDEAAYTHINVFSCLIWHWRVRHSRKASRLFRRRLCGLVPLRSTLKSMMIGSTVPLRFLPRPSPALQPIFLMRNSPTPPLTGVARRNWSWRRQKKNKTEKAIKATGQDEVERPQCEKGNKKKRTKKQRFCVALCCVACVCALKPSSAMLVVQTWTNLQSWGPGHQLSQWRNQEQYWTGPRRPPFKQIQPFVSPQRVRMLSTSRRRAGKWWRCWTLIAVIWRVRGGLFPH